MWCFVSLNVALSHSKLHSCYFIVNTCYLVSFLINSLLNNGVTLKMAPFDRPCTTFCWLTIVSLALSCRLTIFFVNNFVKLWVKRPQSSGEARGFAVGGCRGGLGAEPPAGSS